MGVLGVVGGGPCVENVVACDNRAAATVPGYDVAAAVGPVSIEAGSIPSERSLINSSASC